MAAITAVKCSAALPTMATMITPTNNSFKPSSLPAFSTAPVLKSDYNT